MNEPQSQPEVVLHEELVAYLDGELEPQASREVEQRLAADAECRHLLRILSQAWDALDELPHVQPDEKFAGTTVAMVAGEAREEVSELKATSTRRRIWGVLSAAAGLALALLFGFLITQALLPQPDEELLADLPVIENVDLYIYADDIEFLRQLDEAGLFGGEVEGETSNGS